MSGRLSILLAGAALLSAGCQSTVAPVPAVLTRGDQATIEQLKAALAKAMGRTQVELGPGDPTQTSAISVLPRPPGVHDDRSLAMPTHFRVELRGKACMLVREDTGAPAPAGGLACRPAAR